MGIRGILASIIFITVISCIVQADDPGNLDRCSLEDPYSCPLGNKCRRRINCETSPCPLDCYRISNLGESCSRSKDCYAGNLLEGEYCERDTCGCYRGVCACKEPGYVNIDGDCKAELGSNCSKTTCADPLADCVMLTCECVAPNFEPGSTGICIPPRPYKDVCYDATDNCATSGATCRQNMDLVYRCRCDRKTEYYNSTVDACFPLVDYNTVCPRGAYDVCNTTGATCQDMSGFKCLCTYPDIHDSARDECYTPHVLGGACQRGTDLCESTNAKCRDLVCSCGNDEYFDMTANGCFPYVEFGATCTRDPNDECATENATCQDNGSGTIQCLCIPGHVFVGAYRACLPVGSYMAPCKSDKQCDYPGGVCKGNQLDVYFDGSYCQCELTAAFSTIDSSCREKTDCGRDFLSSEVEGTFFSQNFPNNYDANTVCVWNIFSEGTGIFVGVGLASLACSTGVTVSGAINGTAPGTFPLTSCGVTLTAQSFSIPLNWLHISMYAGADPGVGIAGFYISDIFS